MPTTRPLLTVALLAGIGLADWAFCGRAGAQGPQDRQIREQLARQAELLAEVRGEAQPVEPDALPETTSEREAAAAPLARELPPEIFETSRVEVPAGAWGQREARVLLRLVLDADGDGQPELIRWQDPASGQRVRQQEDRNYDGIQDAWSDYAGGRIVARALDSNDDGNPDVWERYHEERMSSREIDRDDDGVRDAFYRYQGDSLVEERHDADNDGRIDLVIHYEQRRRVRAEEDSDRDGRMDTWTHYLASEGGEHVTRIERDRAGRGFADTFESFELRGGRAVLLRREEDSNGDGTIDVTSLYDEGKLRKRQISSPRASLPESAPDPGVYVNGLAIGSEARSGTRAPCARWISRLSHSRRSLPQNLWSRRTTKKGTPKTPSCPACRKPMLTSLCIAGVGSGAHHGLGIEAALLRGVAQHVIGSDVAPFTEACAEDRERERITMALAGGERVRGVRAHPVGVDVTAPLDLRKPVLPGDARGVVDDVRELRRHRRRVVRVVRTAERPESAAPSPAEPRARARGGDTPARRTGFGS